MKRLSDVHTPYPSFTETGVLVGGRAVITAQTVVIRCGCRDDLRHEYGHETEMR